MATSTISGGWASRRAAFPRWTHWVTEDGPYVVLDEKCHQHSEAKEVVEVRLCMLDASNAALLEQVAPGVFDHPIEPRWRDEFVQDSRHHLALAIAGSQVVGMASGVHYVHPDKAPEMWINEVGVAPAHRGAGLGRRLVEQLLIRARELGCHEAWVLTDQGNRAAMRMYAKAGGLEEPMPSTMFTFKLPQDAAVD